MKALRIVPHILFPLIFSLFFLIGFGCDDDDDDDSAAADDDDSAAAADESVADDDDNDSLDDDFSDDDLDDDDATDDDTISDADTTDDDTVDDDTDDDDDWPDICQNQVPGSDDCGLLMFFLYCRLGYPIIIEDSVFTQLDAELACRDAAEPVWVDILECSDAIIPIMSGGFITEFVGCLAEKEWPPQQADIFDATQWLPADEKKSAYNVVQSLNFWSFIPTDAYPFGIREIGGAVVDLLTPSLRASNCQLWDDGRYWSLSFAVGDSTSWQPENIVFWLEGEWESGGIGGYDQGTIAEEMCLAPAPQ